MRHPPNKDLFAESTMTFGEHLEELRSCLFKALIGLALGVVVGLFVGGDVVDYIQRPLSGALTSFYQTQSIRRANEEAAKLASEGLPVITDPAQVAHMVETQEMLPQEVFLNPADLISQLQRFYPEEFHEVPEGKNPDAALEKSNLLRIYLWHSLKDDTRIRVKSLSAHEAFTIYMKASILVGAVLASPWVFYQLWSFVAAGLYSHEKRYVYVFFPFSLGLFLGGAALAFFVVFEPVLKFLFGFNNWMGIDPDPRISEWLGFVLILPLGFGIGFQLPLVMLFLERIGIFTVRMYLNQWRIAVLAIAVLAMILTPPDPYSMTLLGGPLVGLYFGGILLCRFLPRMRSPYSDLDA